MDSRTEQLRISAEDVLDRVKRGEKIRFLDTRNPTAWGEATEQVAGAMRTPADRAAELAPLLSHDETIVAYCT